MANLDISIIFFALLIVLMLDILAIGLRTLYLAIFAMIFGIVSLAYFIQNYTEVIIGSFVIPFQLFIIAWVLLCILASFVIALKVK